MGEINPGTSLAFVDANGGKSITLPFTGSKLSRVINIKKENTGVDPILIVSQAPDGYAVQPLYDNFRNTFKLGSALLQANASNIWGFTDFFFETGFQVESNAQPPNGTSVVALPSDRSFFSVDLSGESKVLLLPPIDSLEGGSNESQLLILKDKYGYATTNGFYISSSGGDTLETETYGGCIRLLQDFACIQLVKNSSTFPRRWNILSYYNGNMVQRNVATNTTSVLGKFLTSNASVVNINASNLNTSEQGWAILPKASDSPGQTILLRDWQGTCRDNGDPNNLIRISINGSDSIDIGKSNLTLSTAYESVQLTSDGIDNWMITGNYKWGLPRYSYWSWDAQATLEFTSLLNATKTENFLSLNDAIFNASYFWQTCNYPVFALAHRFRFRFPSSNDAATFCFVINSNNASARGSIFYFGYGCNGYAGIRSNGIVGDLTQSYAIRFVGGYNFDAFFPTQGQNPFGEEARGLAVGPAGFGSPVLAVGKGNGIDTGSTIKYSANGIEFAPLPNGFRTAGNGVIFSQIPGSTIQGWVALGEDVDPKRSVLFAPVGAENTWTGLPTPGFSVSGLGVATASNPSTAEPTSIPRFVAVGQDSTSNRNIQWSANGQNFAPSVGAGFHVRANGVGVNNVLNPSVYVIVGEQGNATPNILFGNGYSNNLTDGSFDIRGNGVAFGQSPFASNLAPGGNRWVAVGAANTSIGTIKVSLAPSGANAWTDITEGGFSVQGNGVAYANSYNFPAGPIVGRWVAVGEHVSTSGLGTIQYSDDGYNWYPAANGFSTAGYAVAWNGSRFVAVGNDGADAAGQIKYSSNGINWSNHTGANFSTTGYDVKFVAASPGGPNQFMATGDSSNAVFTVLVSSDGSNWSSGVASNGFVRQGRGLAYNSGLGVLTLVGQHTTDQQKTIQYAFSNSLTTLRFLSPGFSGGAYGAAFDPTSNILIVVGSDANISNSIQWTNNIQLGLLPTTSNIVNGFTGGARAVIYSFLTGATGFWAVGIDANSNKTIQYSPTGRSNWNSPSYGFVNGGYGIVYSPPLGLVAVGDAGGGPAVSTNTILWTTDGTTWNPAASGGFLTRGRAIAYNGIKWIAVGDNGSPNDAILESFDGSNWKAVQSPGFLGGGRAVVNDIFSGPSGRWYVGGSNALNVENIYYSSTLINRSSSTDILSNALVPSLEGASGPLQDIEFLSQRDYETTVHYSGSNFRYTIQDMSTFSTFTSNLAITSLFNASNAYFGFLSARSNNNGQPRILNWDAFASPDLPP